MQVWPTTVFVTDQIPAELRQSKGRARVYLFIQNISAFDVYVNENSRATADFGTVLGAGLTYELDRGVPQGTIYIAGSQATRQQLNVKEGY